MTFDADAAYQAILARDARFDGRLFVGVTSTGVYCRPICRVRTPQKKNCRFFGSAAQAEAAAFRPCLKCRPEIAPGQAHPWTVMDASRTLAHQAALGLEAEAANGEAPSVAALAARLGVSERHLRRIFAAEHGVTPLQYVQTRRLLLAKQLLTDTRLPVSQVALSSGFRSLRRFNAAFAESYRMNPARLRKEARTTNDAALVDDPAVTVTLAYRTPYAVEPLLRFLAARAIGGVEKVDGLCVRRSVRASTFGTSDAAWLEATFVPDRARVRLAFAPALAPASAHVIAAARRWLDLDAAPDAIDAALADLPGEPGLRLPGSVDPFELAVRAVLGQQVTVAAARTLARRLVEALGTAVTTPWPDIGRAFPAPDALARVAPERIAELGIIRTRANAIVALAQAWPRISARLAKRTEPEALIAALCDLPGIGPWTAHYIAMRALGWPDAHLPGDVAVLAALRRLHGELTPRAAQARTLAWQPWRSYAVLRLWNSLETST
ncbi:MAG TPA: Ada metal-binding domain-containing protein [Caldimonas sp.]|nr:Ada metal-binding domain-containing protein [Caldimonas sp.]